MECLQHILCRSCLSPLGKEEEVIMCGGCKLWQHRTCIPDVLPSFYAQFYVSVLQEQKPKHWMCYYCSKYGPRAPNELPRIKLEKEGNPLQVPHSNSPISMDISDSDSESELHMSFDNNRIEREGLAQYPATSLSSLEDRATPEVEILISPRPVLFDPSPLPTTYALYKQPDGQTVVKDCHGNEFKHTKNDIYWCVREGCGFKVRAREDLTVFLNGGEASKKGHNHDMPVPSFRNPEREQMEDSDDSDTLPTPGATPYSCRRSMEQAARHKRDRSDPSTDSSTDDDQCPSPVRPTTPPTPANTPARTKMLAKKSAPKAARICSDSSSTSSETEPRIKMALHRRPLNKSKLRKSSAKYILSSSSSSSDDSSDDMDTAVNLGRPANNTPVNTGITSSTDSSDSSDEEPESTNHIPEMADRLARKGTGEPENVSITYTLTDGLASGNQARLTDSQGYCYQMKYKLGLRVFWTCTEKKGRCSATVVQQRQDKFTQGAATHNHEPSKSQNTSTLPSTTVEPTQQNIKLAATVEPTQQNVKSAATVKPTQQNVNSAANVEPTQQNVKSAATVRTTRQNVKSAATVKPTQQNVNSAANVEPTQQNVKSAATVRTTRQNGNSAATVEPTQQNVNSAANVEPTQQNVKSAATAQNSKSETTQTSEETATPVAPTDVLYQEISTCTMYRKRPQSILIASDGYIYKTKKQDLYNEITVWKCTHKGLSGKCKGQVQFNYTTYTFRYDYSDPFVWTEDQSNAVKVVPHNHQPDMEAAVIVKMKAMIHRQVYGYGHHNYSAREIIDRAVKSMCDWEKQYVPTHHVERLKKFVWGQQKQYRDEPRMILDRYYIDRGW